MVKIKKRKSTSFKKKHNKKVKSEKEVIHSEILNTKITGMEVFDSEILREGLLVLGCITSIEKYRVVLSLPGCFFATVEANNVSNTFSQEVANFTDECETELPSLESVLQVGMVYPCKLIKIERDSYKRLNIFASLKPEDVNSSLRPSSLYHKMVLYVSVCSVEDHGYAVNVGTDQIQAFLPKLNSGESRLNIGQIIPTFIQKIHLCEHSAIVQLAKLNIDDEFPNVSTEVIHLHSILPGAKIIADVIEVRDKFLKLKYQNFDVCASLLTCSSNKNLDIGSMVEGTVLFVNPVSHVIHITLHSVPTPSRFLKYFQLKKFEFVKNPKFLYSSKKQDFYKIGKGSYGFIQNKHLLQLSEGMTAISSNKKNIEKARIIKLHYMDNLIQLSTKPSIMEEKVILPAHVQVGDTYDVVIQKHAENGMFVKIAFGCYGFIRRLHISDIYLTKPEVLHPIGSKVRCRVLSTDGQKKINLTAKKSLLDLEECFILSSYDSVHIGQCYKGVIVKKLPAFIIVLFFNDVKGVVHNDHIPESSVYFVGQTVFCEALWCNPAKKRLKLSLKTHNKNFQGKKGASADTEDQKLKYHTNETKGENIAVQDMCDNASSHLLRKRSNFKNMKLQIAVIQKVRNHQLNIMLKKSKGCVHITNLGCTSEGVYPLKNFSAKQKIPVYVFGKYLKKRRNYIEVTHQNTVALKDCTLSLPPSCLHNLQPGSKVIGFVKNVYDNFATIWLSPTKTGILEYLHFSENPKVVRKLSSHLKVGLSLEVQIWKVFPSHEKKEKHNIILSKKDFQKPAVGSNVLGLVQITCLERGLFLKLPFGYHGTVCITDLSDVYAPVSTQFQKYMKMKFILCHVIEVNHETKYCQLSLRKSRLFQKIVESDYCCPEVIPDIVKEGDCVRGYVKSASDSAITVVIGRKLEGKVQLHCCTIAKCQECLLSKNVLKKYTIGSVIDVLVQRILDHNNLSFTLDELKYKENKKCHKLSVDEDIQWEEMTS